MLQENFPKSDCGFEPFTADAWCGAIDVGLPWFAGSGIALLIIENRREKQALDFRSMPTTEQPTPKTNLEIMNSGKNRPPIPEFLSSKFVFRELIVA